nr:type II toxin-antitoxin system VapC family toxin [Nocardioidaceae bacterium]
MLLLDTHVVLWVLDDHPKLGAGARRRLAAEFFVHVSAASVLELTIKSMLGRLALPDNLEQALDDQGFLPLPVTAAHASSLRLFPELGRHDPFDRLLLGQARIEKLQLLTADRSLLATGYHYVVDA